MEEYISTCVLNIKEICDAEGISHPHIVTESGRALTAHHACLILNVVEAIESQLKDHIKPPVHLESSKVIQESFELLSKITPTRALEVYHQAIALREDILNRFKLGLVSLDERAFVEEIVREIRRWIYRNKKRIRRLAEELEEITEATNTQYLVNFSVFQSAPDHWAFDQLFPIVPIHRMQEEPRRNCTLVDISCDSDGMIDRFIARRADFDTSLTLHQLNGKPYYLGIFLTGAYQDIMGDLHNLFGRVNEVHVFSDDDDPEDFYIQEAIRGDIVRSVLEANQYVHSELVKAVKSAVEEQVKNGKIKPRDGMRLVDFYEQLMQGYTYLRT